LYATVRVDIDERELLAVPQLGAVAWPERFRMM
jgi:hypothetical protein